jgi:hypothetical protein
MVVGIVLQPCFFGFRVQKHGIWHLRVMPKKPKMKVYGEFMTNFITSPKNIAG